MVFCQMRRWSSHTLFRTSSQAVLLIRQIVTGSLTSVRTPSLLEGSPIFSSAREVAFVPGCPNLVGTSASRGMGFGRPVSQLSALSQKRFAMHAPESLGCAGRALRLRGVSAASMSSAAGESAPGHERCLPVFRVLTLPRGTLGGRWRLTHETW